MFREQLSWSAVEKLATLKYIHLVRPSFLLEDYVQKVKVVVLILCLVFLQHCIQKFMPHHFLVLICNFFSLPPHMEQNEIKEGKKTERRKIWKELMFSKRLLQLLICGKPQWKLSKMAASFDMRIRKWPGSSPWLILGLRFQRQSSKQCHAIFTDNVDAAVEASDVL